MCLPPPRAAYLHIPFCKHRCGYCNFSVITGRDDLAEPILSALATELSWLGSPQPVDTLYFGGGTPTQLLPAELHTLCQATLVWHPLSAGYEWTVEANPADLDAEKIHMLASQGVNRISLGSQSFDAYKLALLERDHAAGDIYKAVELARQANLDVALDLIFGVPGETLTQWESDLDEAIRLEPDHISTYGLTFERGTQFWNRRKRGDLIPVAEELERDMYLLAIERLKAAGFEHYEISNFARPRHRSRHNETYWSGKGYFAAGPGAARYVGGVRQTNHRSTTTYLNRIQQGKSPVADEEQLGAEARAREVLVFGLRQLAGVKRTHFETQTKFTVDELAGNTIRGFVELGMLHDDGEQIHLTRDGLLISDSLWPELL